MRDYDKLRRPARPKRVGQRVRSSGPRNSGSRSAEDRAKHAAYQRAWEAANREKMLVIWRNKRARRAKAEGRHSLQDILRIERAQKGRCAYCRRKLGKRVQKQIDHIMPLAKGGSNNARNIQLACDDCNFEKRAQHPIDFARSRGLLV